MTEMTTDASFRQLGLMDMPAPVLATWQEQFPNADVLREWIFGELVMQLGIDPQPANWIDVDRERAGRWFNVQLMDGDFAFRVDRRLNPIIFSSLSGKASTIAQRACSICHGLSNVASQFPVEILPIRIAPQSRQSLGQNWLAYQGLMAKRFSSRKVSFGKTSGLCLAVTFVLSNGRPDKDLDNIAKALGDALSRALGFDDKHIHHLDLAKLRGPFQEEYVIVRAAPSHLSDDRDVMVPEASHIWAVGEAMHLPSAVKPEVNG